LAVYLDGPWRLIFEPANDPVPKKPDGGLDWTQVTVIRILEVRDYHD
jgi:proteic killer suppression protein